MSMMVDEAIEGISPLAEKRPSREEMRQRVWDMFTAPDKSSATDANEAQRRLQAEADAAFAGYVEPPEEAPVGFMATPISGGTGG